MSKIWSSKVILLNLLHALLVLQAVSATPISGRHESQSQGEDKSHKSNSLDVAKAGGIGGKDTHAVQGAHDDAAKQNTKGSFGDDSKDDHSDKKKASSLHKLGSNSPTINVKGTHITGKYLHSSGSSQTVDPVTVARFANIPYAEAPTGNARLARPRAVSPAFSSHADYTDFGPICPQIAEETDTTYGFDQSEDCLSINVYVPKIGDDLPSSDAKLPVLVWFHEGSFVAGAARTAPGENIVAEGVKRHQPFIFVTFDYRLGPLGFPQGSEAENADILNLGLWDQRLALKWVKNYIRSFGGNEDKITLIGESAGAISIHQHLLSPSFIDDIAVGTITQSGSAATSLVFDAKQRQEDQDSFAQALGCPKSHSINCIRRAHTNTVQSAVKKVVGNIEENGLLFPFTPVIDGELIRKHPYEILKEGSFSKLPNIATTVQDEGTTLIPDQTYSSDDVEELLKNNLSPYSSASRKQQLALTGLLKLYNVHDTSLLSPFGEAHRGDQEARLAAIIGDAQFQALRREFSQAASEHGIHHWAALYTEAQKDVDGVNEGVYHTSDIPYLFGTETTDKRGQSAAAALTSKILDNYINFVFHQKPKDYWPEYAHGQVLYNLSEDHNSPTTLKDVYRKEQIDFIIAHDPLEDH